MSDINSYIWKDARLNRWDHNKKELQAETRLIDMDKDQLQMCYAHCKEMLYNTNSKNIGRMIILDQISQQLDYCGAELAFRYFLSLKDKNGNYLYSKESLLSDLHTWVRSVPNYSPKNNYRLKDFLTLPSEYQSVLIESLMKACRDALGVFNHSKITKTFIYDRLGIYLTSEELKSIDNDIKSVGIDPEKVTLQEKIENHIKFPLGLSGVEIKINPKGLSGAEFKDMVNLKKLKGYQYCKYSSLTSDQLKTLRNKVLYALEERTAYQVMTWKTLMSQIEEVARYKEFTLE